MRPQKLRDPGSHKDLLVRAFGEIAEGEGRDRAAGPEIAAHLEGKTANYFRHATDPDRDDDLPFRRVVRLARHFKVRAFAEYFATLAGGVFLPLSIDGAPVGDKAAITAKEFAEAMAAHIQSIQSGSEGGRAMTPTERAHVIREIDETMRALAEWRAEAMAQAEEATPGS